MTSDNSLPELGETLRDKLINYAKVGIGSIPLGGPLMAELILNLIPNQRLQRIETFLDILSAKIEKLDAKKIEASETEKIDLFEVGAVQALRALSDERMRYISELVANGIQGDKKDAIEAKRLLQILAELDDDQIIILVSYLRKNSHDASFQETHHGVLDPVHQSRREADQEGQDAVTIWQLSRSRLMSLGLLQAKFKAFKKGELPDFDNKTGMLKASSRDLTPLARLLLRRIGLAGPNEL